ncbi:MAG: TetR/AcrR family transcriptional regulator [Thermotaleaceae bacterium]
MATAFTDEERVIIREGLKEADREYLAKYGVRRTTVDQLVDRVGISKGSFYNFYKQKELLFFQVLEEYQVSLIEDLNQRFKEEDIGVEGFTEIIFQLIQNVRRSFLMNIIENNEIEYLFRRLAGDLIKEHNLLDRALMDEILKNINLKENVDPDLVVASFRALFLSLTYVDEIGAKDFDNMLKFLIRGMALQLIEEDGHGAGNSC